MPLYGTQPQPRPGQGAIGYGPAGQIYNPLNPVVMTTSGVRPASVAAAGQRQQQQAQPAQPSQSSGNSILDAINRMMGGPYGMGSGGAPTGGAYGGGSGGSPAGRTNIQTSITPQNIYSPQRTQEAANSAVASQHIPMEWLQGQMAGRGMSVRSPGVTTAMMPAYAQGIVGGQRAAAQIPFADAQANAQHMLAGETGRENEAIGWARQLSGLEGVNRNFQLNSLQSLLSLLGAFM